MPKNNQDKIEKEIQKIETDLPVDTSQFKEMTPEELALVLGTTIKLDNTNKVLTFLCQLSAYTEDASFNASYNAPSSTGKSYIPLEISAYFPDKDVIVLAYSSPTAFFHDVGKFNKERKGYEIDLSDKVIVFLDQPHTDLLARLRPLLSHDKKELHLKITDKNQKAGLRTKNVFIKGYPAVIFCTAGLQIDEQESTRFILLSPEMSQEKIRAAIHQRVLKETDLPAFRAQLDGNPERQALKRRVIAIKQAGVRDVRITNSTLIEELYLSTRQILKSRHQRDIGRVIAITKTLALLNVFFRQRDGDVAIATDEDIARAITLWESIAESQEHNIAPYIFSIYRDVIAPAYEEKNTGLFETERRGLNRKEILKKYHQLNDTLLSETKLRQDILPPLETAGLITSEKDDKDGRVWLYTPATAKNENNSEPEGGVSDSIVV